MTEFVVVLPLFLILTFASLGLARLVYVRWSLEERTRFSAFSKAHGAEPEELYKEHLSHRPKPPNYTSGVLFSALTSPSGDLLALVKSSSIDSPERGDPIPTSVLSPRQPRGSEARQASRSRFWRTVYQSQTTAPRQLERSFRELNGHLNRQLEPMHRLNPYLGSRTALRKFNRAMSIAHDNSRSSPSSVLAEDKIFQSQYLSSIKNDDPYVRDSFSLTKTVTPKRSLPGAFQGVMRNVLAIDSSLIDTQIDNSVLHTEVVVSGLESTLNSLPLHGMANKNLTSELYILTNSWDIDRQNGTSWRSVGSQESTYHDSDEEGILRRRTMGLWMLPSNPGALLEPMTDLFPHQLRSVVHTMNGPISAGITIIKKFFGSDNPLTRLLKAIHHLPVIGSITDIELPEWPAVRPEAYPGSVEMKGDRLNGKKRNFKDYVTEQRSFLGRKR